MQQYLFQVATRGFVSTSYNVFSENENALQYNNIII